MDVISGVEPLAAGLTALYEEIFAEVDTLAVQRHMLYPAECREIWANPQVQKWIAFEGTTPVGMATITNSLGAWPLISARYFARHEPERYAARKIWYIGFVGIRPGNASGFADLVLSMAPQVVDPYGMAVMDFCHYNVAVRQLPRVTQALLTRYARRSRRRSVMTELDQEHFVAWTFPDVDGY